jgi:hypothetical protein
VIDEGREGLCVCIRYRYCCNAACAELVLSVAQGWVRCEQRCEDTEVGDGNGVCIDGIEVARSPTAV